MHIWTQRQGIQRETRELMERCSFGGLCRLWEFQWGQSWSLPSFLGFFSIISPPDTDRLEGGKCNPATLWGGLLKIEINSIEGGLRSQWTLEARPPWAKRIENRRRNLVFFRHCTFLTLSSSARCSLDFLREVKARKDLDLSLSYTSEREGHFSSFCLEPLAAFPLDFKGDVPRQIFG